METTHRLLIAIQFPRGFMNNVVPWEIDENYKSILDELKKEFPRKRDAFLLVATSDSGLCNLKELLQKGQKERCDYLFIWHSMRDWEIYELFTELNPESDGEPK